MADARASAGIKRPSWPGLTIAIAAAIALALILIDYFLPHGTIAHSWGALLVVISTALMLVAALAIGLAALPRWLRLLLEVLLILDILGSGVCAWFLETYVILALMIVALIAWLAQIGRRSASYGS